MKEELRKIIPFLDPKCHLFAEMEVSDEMSYCGVPMDYIARDLGRTMGNHVSDKLPMIMQRTDRMDSFWYHPRYAGLTTYRAELFVFTESELFKLVERVQNDTYNTKVSEGVAKELKSVTGKVKAELKQKIDKVLS